ncbi:MAG: DUF2267 domain-containing protein [Verrucomicrobiota bacterium]|jgi:uncharacterized protein (DUF2267 family)
MTYDEFTGHVQHRARLGTTGEAVKAIRATLETLAERLDAGEAKDLASQLPEEIGIYLRKDFGAKGERFDLNEFFSRVSLREQMDLPVAVYHARVVIEVLQEAVSPGEINDVIQQLPPEFSSLFLAGSTGEMARRD